MFSSSSEASSAWGSALHSPTMEGRPGAYIACVDTERSRTLGHNEGSAADLRSKMATMNTMLAELSSRSVCAEDQFDDFSKSPQGEPLATDRAYIPMLLSTTENIAENVKGLFSLVNEQQGKIEDIIEDAAKTKESSERVTDLCTTKVNNADDRVRRLYTLFSQVENIEKDFVKAKEQSEETTGHLKTIVNKLNDRLSPLVDQVSTLKQYLLEVARETRGRIKTIEVDLAARKCNETEKEARPPASPQHRVEKKPPNGIERTADERALDVETIHRTAEMVEHLLEDQDVLELQQEKLQAELEKANAKRERLESTLDKHEELFTCVHSNINSVTSSLNHCDMRIGTLKTTMSEIASEAFTAGNVDELKNDFEKRFAALRESTDNHMALTNTRLAAVEQRGLCDDACGKDTQDRIERLLSSNTAVFKKLQLDTDKRVEQTETRLAVLEQRSSTECALSNDVDDRVTCNANDLVALRHKMDDHIARTETRIASLEQRVVDHGAPELEDRIAQVTQSVVTLRQSTSERLDRAEQSLFAVKQRSLMDSGTSNEIEDYMVQTEKILDTMCRSTEERFAKTESRLAALDDTVEKVEDYVTRTEHGLATLRASTEERIAHSEGRLASVEERVSHDAVTAKTVEDLMAHTAERCATLEQRLSENASSAKEVKNFLARTAQSLAQLRRTTDERIAHTNARLASAETRSVNDSASAKHTDARVAAVEKSLAALRHSLEERLVHTDMRLATVERPAPNNAATAKECSTLAGDLSTIRQSIHELQARTDTRLATLEQQRGGNDAVAVSLSDHQMQTEMRLSALQRSVSFVQQCTEEYEENAARMKKRLDVLERQHPCTVGSPAKDARECKECGRQGEIIKRLEALEAQQHSQRYDDLAAKVASISVTPRIKEQHEFVMGELESFDSNVHERVELFRGEHIKTVNLLRSVVTDLDAERDQLHRVKEDVQVFRDDIDAVKHSVRKVKEDVQSFRSDVQGVKNEVQGVRGDVLTLKDSIQTVKGELLTLKYCHTQVIDRSDSQRHTPSRALRQQKDI